MSMALASAFLCVHAVAAQDAKVAKDVPPRVGLPQFESAVLSGQQTKSSAYRRVSNARDPEAPAHARDGKPGEKPKRDGLRQPDRPPVAAR